MADVNPDGSITGSVDITMTATNVLPKELNDAILFYPDEDEPRIEAAIWFDNHGQEDRAELIFIQLEMAKLPQVAEGDIIPDAKPEKDWVDLLRMQDALLAKYVVAATQTVKGKNFGLGYRRGFVHCITHHLEPLMAHGHLLMQQHPLEKVRLYPEATTKPEEVPFTLTSPTRQFKWYQLRQTTEDLLVHQAMLPTEIYKLLPIKPGMIETPKPASGPPFTSYPTQKDAYDALSHAVIIYCWRELKAMQVSNFEQQMANAIQFLGVPSAIFTEKPIEATSTAAERQDWYQKIIKRQKKTIQEALQNQADAFFAEAAPQIVKPPDFYEMTQTNSTQEPLVFRSIDWSSKPHPLPITQGPISFGLEKPRQRKSYGVSNGTTTVPVPAQEFQKLLNRWKITSWDLFTPKPGDDNTTYLLKLLNRKYTEAMEILGISLPFTLVLDDAWAQILDTDCPMPVIYNKPQTLAKYIMDMHQIKSIGLFDFEPHNQAMFLKNANPGILVALPQYLPTSC